MSKIRELQPPEVEKEYGEWTVIGEPIQRLIKSYTCGAGYQNGWMVPCECSCGRRDLVNYQNLKRGLSEGCIVCGNHTPRKGGGKRPTIYEAFGENKTIAEWAKDKRCPCTATTLYKFLRSGLTLEEGMARAHSQEWRRGMLLHEQVREIYRRIYAGEAGADLAREFDVYESTVSRIKLGKLYRRVTKIFGWKLDDLPKWDEIHRRREDGEEKVSPLEEFIHENEPSGAVQSEFFRKGLLDLINFVLEEAR
jgi:hypothetical protein